MYIILALIAIVLVALWRSSKQLKQQADPKNNYKAKQKNNAAAKRKAKVKPVVQKKQAAPAATKAYRTKTINLHHPKHASDDLEKTDQALGLQQQSVNNVSAEPVMLYLVADNNDVFGGFHLLQNLLSTGLKMNKQGVFEKVMTANHSQKVLFKVASMTNPGTFPKDKIDGFTTKGLVFFMESNEDKASMLQNMESMFAQLTLTQARLGGNIFTPDKTLLEPQDFKRYAEYVCDYAVC